MTAVTTTNPLYQDAILDHQHFPRNKGLLEDADATSHGGNPTCGDDLLVSVRLRGATVPAVGWDGHACAIGAASASMMAEAVEGLGVDGARQLIQTVRRLLTGTGELSHTGLEDLASLAGIRQYPVRITCALLAWEALDEALTMAEGAVARAAGAVTQGGPEPSSGPPGHAPVGGPASPR